MQSMGPVQPGPEVLAGLGEDSLAILRVWDVRLPAENRLHRAVRTLITLRSDASITREAWAEAAKTINEFGLITSLKIDNLEPVVRRKLKESLGGRALPDSRRGCSARNTQFELLLWAILGAAGVSPTIAEPDLRFRFRGEEVGIAAKRIWSPANAEKRLANGLRQVRASGIRGFVATNVGSYLHPAAAVGTDRSRSEAFGQDVRSLDEYFRSQSSQASLLGYIQLGYATSTDPSVVGIDLTLLTMAYVYEGRLGAPEANEEFGELTRTGLRALWMGVRQRMAG